MASYAVAAVWGAFVLCSMVGWGGLIAGLLRVRPPLDWPRNATVGFAFSACIGGALDLTGLISVWLIVAFLTAGVVAFVLRFKRSSANKHLATRRTLGASWLAIPTLAAAGALLALRVAGSVIVLQPPNGMQPGSFNTHDDFQAYIVYPLKMLNTGSMGSDPFSVRRTPTHALGGNAFLQTFVLSALPIQSVRLLDVALGTVLVVGLLWFYMAQRGLTTLAAASVIVVFLAIPPPLINVTAVLIPLAFFISLFILFVDNEREMTRVARATLVGLHVAGICVLKTNLIPAALAFVGGRWALAVLRSPSTRGATVDGIVWFTAAGIAILPWLLDAFRWTGTFIPGSLAAYHADETHVATFEAVTGWHFLLEHLKELPRPQYIYITMLGVLLFVPPSRVRVPDAFWSLLVAAGIGTIAVTVAVAGSVNNVHRFMYAFVVSTLLIALIQTICTVKELTRKTNRRLCFCAVSVATCLLLFSTARDAMRMYAFNLSSVSRALRGEKLIAPELETKYRSLQDALPEKAKLLEHMDYPFLFDFRRNTILVDDMPGSASMEPGQPFFAGSEALASYLISRDIRYVAYDYAARITENRALAALANDDLHPSAQAVARLILDFRGNLLTLSRSRQPLYDDGTAFLLDLAAPRE